MSLEGEYIKVPGVLTPSNEPLGVTPPSNELLGGGSDGPLPTIPLLNGMVDVALVFGFDETCCRELHGVMEDGDVRS